MKTLIKIIFFLILTQILASQNLIEKLNFLQGNWISEKWGGTIEEYWSAPNGNTIIGMFRFIKDGELQFTEHFLVIEEGDKLTLKLRHFNPDFTGWEDQNTFVEFPSVKIDEKLAKFEGISYELIEASKLKILLEMEENGKIEHEEFIFEKF